MTVGCPLPPATAQAVRFSRRVSSLNMSEEEDNETKVLEQHRPGLRRQVSNEALSCASSDCEDEKKPGSPIRCVSEFDKVAAQEACEQKQHSTAPNPLSGTVLYAQHKRALRLEAQLQPFRLILARLMGHASLNRKGLFNKPVDPVALGLPDYFIVIPKPMDFGTCKAKLHALAYGCRDQVLDDMLLVLQNAMKYNPPQNVVHGMARDLMVFLEEQLQAFVPELAGKVQRYRCETAAKTAVSAVSTALPAAVATVSTTATVSTAAPTSSTSLASPLPSSNTAIPAPAVAPRTPSLAPPVHTQGTRRRASLNLETASTTTSVLLNTSSSRKRKKRGSIVSKLGHDCHTCQGRTCEICHQGCLSLEPTLLVCGGFHCAGARIRKGSYYHITPDGTRQYCPKCFAGLPAVLVPSGKSECRYKTSLLKRKYDEEVVEDWLTCTKCEKGVHAMCAMHNAYMEPEEQDYVCLECREDVSEEVVPASLAPHDNESTASYSYMSGCEHPLPISQVPNVQSHDMSADSLPETTESIFLQSKIRERMQSSERPNAEKTVLVRIISDCDRTFDVPQVVRKHFQMRTSASNGPLAPPVKVNYRSKAIALFQKVDGLDVCIFCMYVQEYDGDDEYEEPGYGKFVEKQKRVYIAYLDSVEHFRPRACRTDVFQEVLVSYLASARARGYETAHIWACPPSRGNSFVFWNHPASQRTPTPERLVAWYHGALSRAVDCGVVTDVQSLYQSGFQKHLEPLSGNPDAIMSGKMECPPLLDGDFWIEEAVRIHDVHFSRNLKSKLQAPPQSSLEENCPALEVASMLRDKIIVNPSSLAFRRPVNAAALKLKDYHKIITKPMDLGTVYCRITLGEYDVLQDVVDDVELVFSNAKRFNPKGHIVHEKAIELSKLFFSQLDTLVASWGSTSGSAVSWLSFADTSMNLDNRFSSRRDVMCDQGASGDASCSLPNIEKDSMDLEDSCHGPCVSGSSMISAADLVGGGADAIHKRMVGKDTWMLDKKNPTPPKPVHLSSKKPGRRKKGEKEVFDDAPPKQRRQSWLAEEVGSAVRRSRTTFFTCLLKPSPSQSMVEKTQCDMFQSYTKSFVPEKDTRQLTNASIADVRHALLEFSQFRSLEFDTLRRAKYSSAVLLYHLHHFDAPGMIPICTLCSETIQRVRWHRISRVMSRRHITKRPALVGRPSQPKVAFRPEELCTDCHTAHSQKEEFIPLQVSFHSNT